MRLLLALSAVALMSLCMIACGTNKRATSTSSFPSDTTTAAQTESSITANQTRPRRDSDEDSDNPTDSYYDKDDDDILAYGQAARAADRNAIAVVVKRYFMVAAANNGAAGCSLIYSLLAESIVEDYGQLPGPPALRGNTCAAVMSKLFKQRHQQLAADVARFKVTGARINGNRGYALLSSHGRLERYIFIHREFGTWKLDGLLDKGLP